MELRIETIKRNQMEREILRAQYDGRKEKWRIAKKTYNGCGGWRSYGSGAIYCTREDAEARINKLTKTQPDWYEKG